MSLFNERVKTAAKENALKNTLRKHGLSHLAVKLRGDQIICEGASEDDIKKLSVALGGATPIITKSGEIDTELTIEIGTMTCMPASSLQTNRGAVLLGMGARRFLSAPMAAGGAWYGNDHDRYAEFAEFVLSICTKSRERVLMGSFKELAFETRHTRQRQAGTL